MIYNEFAIDYSEGVVIFDPVTSITYDEESARQLTVEIKKRLILKPNKIGCYIMTNEEAQLCLKKW